MHVHICMHTYIYTHMLVCTRIHTYMHVTYVYPIHEWYVHAHTRAFIIHADTHMLYTHPHVHACADTVCTHTRMIYVHTYMYVPTLLCTHLYRHTCALRGGRTYVCEEEGRKGSGGSAPPRQPPDVLLGAARPCKTNQGN